MIDSRENMVNKERNAGPELYRILLMSMIVLGHMAWGQSEGWTLWALCVLPIWHVDGFVSLSGWYGVRFSWMKIFKLLGV